MAGPRLGSRLDSSRFRMIRAELAGMITDTAGNRVKGAKLSVLEFPKLTEFPTGLRKYYGVLALEKPGYKPSRLQLYVPVGYSERWYTR